MNEPTFTFQVNGTTVTCHPNLKGLGNWKDLPGYEGLYMVSDLGHVYSFPSIGKGKNGSPLTKRARILKPFAHRQGYQCVRLFINKTKKTVKIHRLVAITFLPNPDNKAEVNHIDGNKSNNHLTNLEWATRHQNVQHAFRTGLMVARNGSKNESAVLTDAQVAEIRKKHSENPGLYYKTTAAEYGVDKTTIGKIVRIETWKN